MSDERQKPSWIFWATVTLSGVPVLYVLSLGPLAGMSKFLPQWMNNTLSVIYWPLRWVYENGPSPIHRALDWYISLFTR